MAIPFVTHIQGHYSYQFLEPNNDQKIGVILCGPELDKTKQLYLNIQSLNQLGIPNELTSPRGKIKWLIDNEYSIQENREEIIFTKSCSSNANAHFTNHVSRSYAGLVGCVVTNSTINYNINVLLPQEEGPKESTSLVKNVDVKSQQILNNTNTGGIHLNEFCRFSENEWKMYLGTTEPPPCLPQDIESILDSNCPFSGGRKKIRETHALVFIPHLVNNKPLTLSFLKDIAQSSKTAYCKIKFSNISSELSNKKINKPCWILITKNILPGSRGQPYQKQLDIINQSKEILYEVPRALEVAVTVLTYYGQTKVPLYSKDSDNESIYTYCIETENQGINGRLYVGGYTGSKLIISVNRQDTDWNDSFAIGAVKRL